MFASYVAFSYRDRKDKSVRVYAARYAPVGKQISRSGIKGDDLARGSKGGKCPNRVVENRRNADFRPRDEYFGNFSRSQRAEPGSRSRSRHGSLAFTNFHAARGDSEFAHEAIKFTVSASGARRYGTHVLRGVFTHLVSVKFHFHAADIARFDPFEKREERSHRCDFYWKREQGTTRPNASASA